MQTFSYGPNKTSHWAEFLAFVGWTRPPTLLDRGDGMGGDLDPSVSTLIRDLAMPPKWRLKPDQTIFIGPEEAWVARLVLELKLSIDDACLFYQERMPGLGWRMISATTHAQISTLAFVRGGRAASIQLEPGRLFGCTTTLILLPHQDAALRFEISAQPWPEAMN